MNPRKYADTIVAAIGADVLAISTHNLPQLDHDSAFADYQASEAPTQAPSTLDASSVAAAESPTPEAAAPPPAPTHGSCALPSAGVRTCKAAALTGAVPAAKRGRPRGVIPPHRPTPSTSAALSGTAAHGPASPAKRGRPKATTPVSATERHTKLSAPPVPAAAPTTPTPAKRGRPRKSTLGRQAESASPDDDGHRRRLSSPLLALLAPR